MPNDPRAVLLTFPPRELSPSDKEMVREWFARAGDIADAYVSTRRSDDPALYRRVVVTLTPGHGPTFLIHGARDQSLWIKITVGSPLVELFPTLRAALNTVRDVLIEVE